MKKIVFLFTTLFCCIINSPAQEEQTEAEEYEVYKVWLEKAFIEPETKQIFLLKFTAAYWDDFTELHISKKRTFLKLQSSTLKNYRERNRNSSELENNFDLKQVVNLVSELDLVNFLSDDSLYKNFEEKFGAEYRIVFSRVGFNKKKNQALIHIHYKSNSLNKYAFGYYWLLSKESGQWVASNYVKSWEF